MFLNSISIYDKCITNISYEKNDIVTFKSNKTVFVSKA